MVIIIVYTPTRSQLVVTSFTWDNVLHLVLHLGLRCDGLRDFIVQQ